MFKQFLICVEIDEIRYGYKYESDPNPNRRRLVSVHLSGDVWEHDRGIGLATTRGKLAKVIIRPLSIGSPISEIRVPGRELSAEDRNRIIDIIETRRVDLLDKEDMELRVVTDHTHQESYVTLSCFGVIYRTAFQNKAIVTDIINEVENDLSFESQYVSNAMVLGRLMGKIHMTVVDPVEYFRSIYLY